MRYSDLRTGDLLIYDTRRSDGVQEYRLIRNIVVRASGDRYAYVTMFPSETRVFGHNPQWFLNSDSLEIAGWRLVARMKV